MHEWRLKTTLADRRFINHYLYSSGDNAVLTWMGHEVTKVHSKGWLIRQPVALELEGGVKLVLTKKKRVTLNRVLFTLIVGTLSGAVIAAMCAGCSNQIPTDTKIIIHALPQSTPMPSPDYEAVHYNVNC